MKKVIDILLYAWQLPQNLLGLLLLAIYGRVTPIDFRGEGWRSRLPLMSGYYATAYDVFAHERGHSIQSMILGPLYLPVIGLPSLLWAAWYRRTDRDVSYYRFYTERWADYLGGVDRGK